MDQESVHPEDRREKELIEELAQRGVFIVGGPNSFNVTLWTAESTLQEITFERSEEAMPLSEKECKEEASKIAEAVRKENLPADERRGRFIDLMDEAGFSIFGFRVMNIPPDAMKLF